MKQFFSSEKVNVDRKRRYRRKTSIGARIRQTCLNFLQTLGWSRPQPHVSPGNKTSKQGPKQKRFFRWLLPVLFLLIGAGLAAFFGNPQSPSSSPVATTPGSSQQLASAASEPKLGSNGRPQLSPLPAAQEVWQCDVVVVSGSLGGVAAAAHSMESGAKTCLIELTPWLGGQISAQGVSAIDESYSMHILENFSASWREFKELLKNQPVKLPDWDTYVRPKTVSDISSCWVGKLCFPPEAGATAAEALLKKAAQFAPGSRWSTSTAFKGAEFDRTGKLITKVYAVRRVPRSPDYMPQGRLSVELHSWYSWQTDADFEKVPIRLEASPGKRLMVIDATDTGELAAWAQVPYRLGSESKKTTGEPHASNFDNPDCTQAFTYPFILAIRDDGGKSFAALEAIKPFYPKHEHLEQFNMDGVDMFTGKSLFNYRRIVSTNRNDPFTSSPKPGDMTVINWTRGNDWNWMDPPLILPHQKLADTGQYANWMGGLSVRALRHGEEHALMFADWLLKNQQRPEFPLTFLTGKDSPIGTASGLSMFPYIREGRRILGRPAYGDKEFLLREQDIREDMVGRDFSPTVIGITHYDIDIHGCRYRNWLPTGEAQRASVQEYLVRPVRIPLESLVPQGIDNLLIGGKGIAVSHIASAVTRVHYGEWSIGAAAGGTAGWLQNQPDLTPATIVSKGQMIPLQQHLTGIGLRLYW